MKRTHKFLSGMTLFSLVAGGASLVAQGQETVPNVVPNVQNGNTQADNVPQRKQVDQQRGRKAGNRDSGTPALSSQPISQEQVADTEAICLTAAAFVKAFNAADVDGISAQFTADADVVDENGNVYQGREAIADAFVASLEKNPGAQIEMVIDSIRFVVPSVAVEDGITLIQPRDDTAQPTETRYTAVHVKVDGKWLTASVREHAQTERRPHRTQLQQLAWLQGDWVDEGADTLVASSCKPVSGGNFLIRNYKVHLAGQEVTSGLQRIGWDPQYGKLKSWIFESTGAYSEGFWQRENDRWILKSCGVTADGQTASSTVIFTPVNSDTMTWQLVDHQIAGEKLPDSEVVTIVRRAPNPASAPEAPHNSVTNSK